MHSVILHIISSCCWMDRSSSCLMTTRGAGATYTQRHMHTDWLHLRAASKARLGARHSALSRGTARHSGRWIRSSGTTCARCRCSLRRAGARQGSARPAVAAAAEEEEAAVPAPAAAARASLCSPVPQASPSQSCSCSTTTSQVTSGRAKRCSSCWPCYPRVKVDCFLSRWASYISTRGFARPLWHCCRGLIPTPKATVA